MTLVSTVAPLVGYAVVFQTIVYFLVPSRRRTLWAPVVTGSVGAAITIGAGLLFGWTTIGLGPVAPVILAGWTLATVIAMSGLGLVMYLRRELRPQLADSRLGALTSRQAFVQIFFRIPVMTALIEEAFFRGVLHAALMALYPPSIALWGGAILFGLWHVGPGFDQGQAAGRSSKGNAIHVVVTVMITALAGAFLVWLRMETGSIWVPFAVHAGINMTMAVWSRAASRHPIGRTSLV